MCFSDITCLHIFVFTAFLCLSSPFVGYGQNSSGKFCNELNTILESAKTGFNSTKGEKTERIISGNPKTFFVNTIFLDSAECYINDVAEYPELTCILASNNRIDEKLTSRYKKLRESIKNCLTIDWVFSDQDSTNNFFLEGTKYRKLVGVKKVDEKKLKIELFMYSSMIEKMRVVELKIEGIATKD